MARTPSSTKTRMTTSSKRPISERELQKKRMQREEMKEKLERLNQKEDATSQRHQDSQKVTIGSNIASGSTPAATREDASTPARRRPLNPEEERQMELDAEMAKEIAAQEMAEAETQLEKDTEMAKNLSEVASEEETETESTSASELDDPDLEEVLDHILTSFNVNLEFPAGNTITFTKAMELHGKRLEITAHMEDPLELRDLHP